MSCRDTKHIFILGGNVNIGTRGPQEFPFDETPPDYVYRPDERVYGANAPNDSIIPHNIPEYRSRLREGNGFFRSIHVGPQANHIWVQIDIVSGSPEPGRNETVTLTVGNDVTGATETYTASQLRPPQTPPDQPYISAYPELREKVNEESCIITMPERGFDVVDASGTDPRSGRTVGGGAYIGPEKIAEEFPKTYLFGADGAPERPDQWPGYPFTIASGPQRTCMHINWSERFRDDGSLELLNLLLQWAGESLDDGQWVQCGVRASLAFG